MNSINATRLVLLLGSLFIITGCAEGGSRYETIERPGLYTTEGGRTALVFSAKDLTYNFIDDLSIPEKDRCRRYSDNIYGGENSFLVCRGN